MIIINALCCGFEQTVSLLLHCFLSDACFLQNLSSASRPRSQPPIYAIRLPGSSSAAAVSSSAASVRTSGAVFLVTKPSANGVSPAAISSSSVYVSSSRSSTVPTTLQSPQTPILASAKMVLMVEVTNVWFGAARCKPCQPIVISEQGIKLVFRDGDNSRCLLRLLYFFHSMHYLYCNFFYFQC